MKRYLPLLGVFILFLLVVSGFAHGETLPGTRVQIEQAVPAAQTNRIAPEMR